LNPLLVDLAYIAILVFGLPFAIYKTLTSQRFRAGWGERFGGVPDLPARHRIWIHCASVGEALLARSLVAKLKTEYPNADIVFSTITNTGRETVHQNFPGHTVFYFPLDLSPVVRKVFRRIKPSAVVLVELELWTNFLAIARRLDVPVVVVNGRITEKTVRHYRLFGALARQQFRNVRHFAVQNEEYAGRVERIRATRDGISVTGTMKYDTVATEVAEDIRDELRRTLRLRPEEAVILGGCTHPGEDELLIDYVKDRQASAAGLRLILAPRHRERAGAVERLIREAGLLPIRKTAIDAGTVPERFEDQPHVILLDTTGELARLYSVATVVFVGGSLVKHGGQNMIEPAALGRPVVFGPHTWNFRDTVELLVGSGGAVQIEGSDELPAVLDELLGSAERRDELGARARHLIRQSKGATERNFEAIRPFLNATG